MVRNRGTSNCDCGLVVYENLQYCDRIMSFSEYIAIIGIEDTPYPIKCKELIIGHWICPECKTELALWLNSKPCFQPKDPNIQPGGTNILVDSSYWESFNDEHGDEFIKTQPEENLHFLKHEKMVDFRYNYMKNLDVWITLIKDNSDLVSTDNELRMFIEECEEKRRKLKKRMKSFRDFFRRYF